MAKVDLKVFKDLRELLGNNEVYEDFNYFIYCLCGGDLSISDEVLGVTYPTCGDRKYTDPSWRQELDAYYKEREQAKSKLEIPYKHLEQEGGGEGGSEYCYGVFQLGDKIYRAEYSYYSHHGHEYDYILDTLKEVKPVEKKITTYEPI